jgi:acyl-CoA synthetase (AMP-forming)/AMP-acid ligase II
MPSELDRKFDAVLAKVSGPGGLIAFGEDGEGRAIVTNLPPTLPGLFNAFCTLHANTEALVAGDERLTFGELNERADAVARALAGGFGIAKGDRVAIAMRNCPSWIASYMGAVKAGAVATLINGWWQPDELRHALALTEPALVICDDPRGRRVEATRHPFRTLVLDVERPLDEALQPLLVAGGADAELPTLVEEDDATILFTSGSTGLSKGAVSTHRAVTTGAYTYAASLITLRGILESEGRPPGRPRTLVSVPLFHVTGEVPVMLNSFVIGRGMVLMPRWDAGEALRLIEKERITYFVGVPTMSLELMQHPDHDRYDLSSLTDIAAGGAPRPVAHVKRLQETFRGAQPALGYGLTETNAVGCGNIWQNYAAKPASTGRPHRPIVELAILGEGDRHLGVGETGEIAIRSAANIRGYWRDPAATAAAFTADGYLRTGDVGYLDEDEYLFIVDRKKEIIIRGGENISAAELEAAIYSHDAVSEAAVFGVTDERLGEVPAAVVWCEEGGLEREELLDHLRTRLAHFKLPAHLWVQDEPLPKLGTGKIDKRTLKQRHLAASPG